MLNSQKLLKGRLSGQVESKQNKKTSWLLLLLLMKTASIVVASPKKLNVKKILVLINR